MINVINSLVILCIIAEFILVLQYGYSLFVALNSNIFNGLTKALSVRFFGGILLHSYIGVSLLWSFFISGDKGYNSIVLFLMSLLMILILLGSVNTYFYYLIKKQVKRNDNEAVRDDKPSSDASIQSTDQ